MLKVQKNSRQMPSDKNYTSDKRYSDLLYSALQEKSVLIETDKGKIRYVEYREVNYTQLGSKINLTRQTVAAKFKYLLDNNLIEDDETNKRYILKRLDPSISTLIPFDTLVKLNDTVTYNVISAFAYILNRYYAEQQKPYVFFINQLKEFLGLSITTRSNNHIVTNILQILKLLGLIEYNIITTEDETMKTIYQITQVNNQLREM